MTFLRKTVRFPRKKKSCVNALWRAYDFSTIASNSRPTRFRVVSILYGELMTFLHSYYESENENENCVNALWRAYDFSTLTSQDAHK